MMTSPTARRSASVQIVARRITVVRSDRTRSGVAAIENTAFVPQPYRAETDKPKSMMFTLISAATVAWSLLAFFGHY